MNMGGVFMNMCHHFIILPTFLMKMGALFIIMDGCFMNIARMFMKTSPFFIKDPALFRNTERRLMEQSDMFIKSPGMSMNSLPMFIKLPLFMMDIRRAWIMSGRMFMKLQRGVRIKCASRFCTAGFLSLFHTARSLPPVLSSGTAPYQEGTPFLLRPFKARK